MSKPYIMISVIFMLILPIHAYPCDKNIKFYEAPGCMDSYIYKSMSIQLGSKPLRNTYNINNDGVWVDNFFYPKTYNCNKEYSCLITEVFEFAVPKCISGDIVQKAWTVNNKLYKNNGEIDFEIMGNIYNIYIITKEGESESLNYNDKISLDSTLTKYKYLYSCANGLIGFGFEHEIYWNNGSFYLSTSPIGFAKGGSSKHPH